VGLLYVDGELAATLPAGRHAFWRYEHNVTVDLVDLRVKTLEVVRDTLTRDNVALRVTLTCTYQVVDAAKAARAVQDPSGYLRKEIQLGLRAAVGGRTLEALLEDERAIDREVVAHLRERFAAIGIAVLGAGVQDMWLPGDAQRLSNAPEAPD
jgi:regulator of protease activity HflC (stomatin/prohibitin superfamily)